MAHLPTSIDHHLALAHAADNGRSAEMLLRDGVLRQTVIALVAGVELAEHNSPDAASLQVLVGRVQVTGFDAPVLAVGDLAVLTQDRHAVTALEDSVFLLTTVTGVPQVGAPERAR